MSFIAEESVMADLSLEQRVAALEAKVAAIERQIEHIPAPIAGRLRSHRPPPTPEEQAVWDEVQHHIREARRADLAEFDREMQRERCDPGEA
jgi:hypothetical protein